MAVSTIDPNGLNIGQIGGTRNLIFNGSMAVAQRGTSSTTSGYGTVDRFKVVYNGGTVTQTQESLSSGDPFNFGFRNFYRATNTSVATDTAADYRVIRTTLEDQDVTTSGWNYTSSGSQITLSFWVRSSVSQEFYAHLNQGIDSYNYAFSLGTLAANTWTKITKTVPGNSNLSFSNDNTSGLEINIVPFWGTNFTTSGSTTDAWYAWNGASRVPDMTSTWATTSGATFDVTGVQLEVGDTATPFEHRSYGQELALCQRYFFKLNTDGASTYSALAGAGWTSAYSYAPYPFPVTMRSSPSFALGGSVGNIIIMSSATQTPATGISLAGGTNKDTAELEINHGTITVGNSRWLRLTSGGTFSFDAEL